MPLRSPRCPICPLFPPRCILLISPATPNEPTEHPAVLEAIRGTVPAPPCSARGSWRVLIQGPQGLPTSPPAPIIEDLQGTELPSSSSGPGGTGGLSRASSEHAGAPAAADALCRRHWKQAARDGDATRCFSGQLTSSRRSLRRLTPRRGRSPVAPQHLCKQTLPKRHSLVPPGALKRCQVRKRGNCCKANTKPFLSGAVKPPRPRQRFSSGAEPCSISVLLAKGTAEHGDANALPKPLPGDSRGMAAVPWGSPSTEKPCWEQRRPRGRASSHRVPAEGLDLALAVPVPLPSLHPRDKPHPSPALPQGPAPPSPPPSAFQLFFTALQGREGGLGRGSSPPPLRDGTKYSLGSSRALLLDPALNGTVPGLRLQPHTQCLQIPRTV